MTETPWLIIRSFAADLTVEGDGRTVEGLCVPYDVPTLVSDKGGVPYNEVWRHGSFKKSSKAPNRVLLNFEHREGISDVVGHGVTLEERADGLHAEFRIHETAAGGTALELARAGVLRGLSIGALVLRSRPVNGVMERLAAHLDHVALCRTPSYAEAVFALRSGSPRGDFADLRPKRNADIDARLAKLGLTR